MSSGLGCTLPGQTKNEDRARCKNKYVDGQDLMHSMKIRSPCTGM